MASTMPSQTKVTALAVAADVTFIGGGLSPPRAGGAAG
jgi:hypothetical protein